MPGIDVARAEKVARDGVDKLDVTVFRDDTDVLGIVFYRHYLAWFERGRENVISPRFLAELYEETGESFVVTKSEQAFKAPARYGDELEVRTVPFQDGPFRLGFDQSVWRKATNELLVSGFVEMVTVSRDFQLAPVPAPVQQLFALFGGLQASCVYVQRKQDRLPPRRLGAPVRRIASAQRAEGSRHERRARFDLVLHQADTDFTGIAFHPNYYCWLERARTEALGRDTLAAARAGGAVPVVRSAKLEYKKGARPYDPLRVWTAAAGQGPTGAGAAASNYMVTLNQEIQRGPEADPETLVVATVEICFVNEATKQLVPIPEPVRSRLQSEPWGQQAKP